MAVVLSHRKKLPSSIVICQLHTISDLGVNDLIDNRSREYIIHVIYPVTSYLDIT